MNNITRPLATKALVIALANAIFATVIFAQAPDAIATRPAFEVASIKPDRSGETRITFLFSPGGRLIVRNAPLRFLITMAYRVKDFQISGAPAWFESERFDVETKAEKAATPDEMLPMLRALLADRFQLTLRAETRELPVYRLVATKNGPRLMEHQEGNCLKPNAPEPPPALGESFAAMPCGRLIFLRPGHLIGGEIHVSGYNDAASSQPGRAVLNTTLTDSLSIRVGRSVIDETGLRGVYDIELQWTSDESGQDDSPGPSILAALQEQLGLRLEPSKGPVEVLVIDHVERPSEN